MNRAERQKRGRDTDRSAVHEIVSSSILCGMAGSSEAVALVRQEGSHVDDSFAVNYFTGHVTSIRTGHTYRFTLTPQRRIETAFCDPEDLRLPESGEESRCEDVAFTPDAEDETADVSMDHTEALPCAVSPASFRIRQVAVRHIPPAWQDNLQVTVVDPEFDVDAMPSGYVLGWHGTRSANVQPILKEGFKVPKVPTNGAVYGRGVYFAYLAKFHVAFEYAVPDERSGSRHVLLTAIRIGTPKQYDPALPVEKLGDSGVDSASHPSVHIMWPNRVNTKDIRVIAVVALS